MKRPVLLFLLFAAMPHAWADTRAELDALRARMNALQQDIDRDLRQKEKQMADLRDIERRIGALAREARGLERDREAAARRLATLRAQQAQAAAERSQQLDWLMRTARTGYISGRQGSLKLLLSQEDPGRLARLLRYQHYFQQTRAERVSTLDRELRALVALAAQVESARRDLDTREQALKRQLRSLDAARAERDAALARLDRELASRQDRLAGMREDERRLERLLDDMRSALNDIPARPGGQPFGELRGRLPWPVPRRIAAAFNSRREGPIRWHGVVLAAPAGTPVRAIHPGRVVFSDWLRGYGLLTIVDHGDNYLSLYGHNQTLLREVGEWVALGDVIALAGDSGGQREAGLYFEIRRNGEPVDPDRWCNSRVTLPPIASR